MFFQFPIAYQKSAHNLKKFALEHWQEAYTQYAFFELGQDPEPTTWMQWQLWGRKLINAIMEEVVGALMAWGYMWLTWN